MPAMHDLLLLSFDICIKPVYLYHIYYVLHCSDHLTTMIRDNKVLSNGGRAAPEPCRTQPECCTPEPCQTNMDAAAEPDLASA